MTQSSLPRILLTIGEPAGIGPDIVIMAARKKWPAELIVIGDPDFLTSRAKQLGTPLKLVPFHPEKTPVCHPPNTLGSIPIKLSAPCTAGSLNSAQATHVIQCLEQATTLCRHQVVQALVTAPVHKGILNDAGIAFTGHTEFFAEHSHSQHPLMLFVIPEQHPHQETRIALATTHLPLADVPAAITTTHLENCLNTLHAELQSKFHLPQPRIAVCGLNPHAGEAGHLGREEIEIITPCLEKLRAKGLHLIGPIAADTAFTPDRLALVDAVLGMYHDQALPVVKHMGYGHAVNLTLGLPFVRTSVDHGVALDRAGTRQANPSSLLEAIRLAIRLVTAQ